MEDLRYDRPVAAAHPAIDLADAHRAMRRYGMKTFAVVPLIAVVIAAGGTTQSCGATSQVAPGRVTERSHRLPNQGTPEAYYLGVTRGGVESKFSVSARTFRRCHMHAIYPACANSAGGTA